MNKKTSGSRILRFIAIVLLAMTSAFHLMGGIGTSCVALFAEKWSSMAALVPYKWLYILFVLVTTVVSIYAIKATVDFAKGKPGSYHFAVMILIVALAISAAHMAASEILRGSSAPASMRVYLNILTLVVFVALRKSIQPGVSKQDAAAGGRKNASAGAAFIVMGTAILSVPGWAGASHTWTDGINYANLWNGTVSTAAWVLVAAGGILALAGLITPRLQKTVLPSGERDLA